LKWGGQFDNIDYLDDQSYSGPPLTVFFAASCAADPSIPCTQDADCPGGGVGACDTSVFNQVPVTTTSGATFDRRGTSTYRLTRNRYYPTPPATTTKETNAFVQDTWQISSRWVLKAGVRATHEKVSGSGTYSLPIDRTVSNRVGTTSFSPGSYT